MSSAASVSEGQVQTSKSLNKSIRAALKKEELTQDSRVDRLHHPHLTVGSYEEKRPVTTDHEGKRRVSTAVNFRKLPGSQSSQRRHINIATLPSRIISISLQIQAEYKTEEYHEEAQKFCDTCLKSDTSESY